MSKISVIVPVYKVEKYLHRCVDSILNQTFYDFKLVLVDDGSPDHCGSICDEYARKDQRVHVIHQANGGLSDARNAGIDWTLENLQSEWITFIDSDDWVHKQYLEALYGAVRENGCKIGICSFQKTLGEEAEVDMDRLKAEVVEAEDYYVSNYINATVAWGKIYHSCLFGNIRYPEGKLHEDEFVTYQILFKEQKAALIGQPLYCYFQNNSGITHTQWSEQKMVVYDAREEQIAYFLKNDFYLAAQLAARNYISGIYLGLKRSRNEIPRNETAIQLYKERAKKIPQYMRILDIRNPYNEVVFMQIRPFRTRAYIVGRAVCNKVRKIL